MLKFLSRSHHAKAAAKFDEPLEESPGLIKCSPLVMAHIAKLVALASTPEAMVEPLYELGMKAATSELIPGTPFTIFGEALLETLAETLGDKLTTEAADAWKYAYSACSAAMQEVYLPSQKAAAAAALDEEQAEY